jgi:hypothetical protein
MLKTLRLMPLTAIKRQEAQGKKANWESHKMKRKGKIYLKKKKILLNWKRNKMNRKNPLQKDLPKFNSTYKTLVHLYVKLLPLQHTQIP